MIEHNTVEKILDAANIVDVVQEYVPLKKRGVNLLGLCPFHNEKTPSFTVSPSKGIFKCFGCGKGGNSVNFIMEHEHLSYPEALKHLAKKYHIEVEEKEASEEEVLKQNERESMLVVSAYASRQFMENLFNSDEGISVGLSYFRERGFRQNVLKKFEIGYSFNKWDAFTGKAISDGYKQEFLVKTGLSIQKEERYFDRFSGRVMFPIHSLSGQVLGFGGRVLKTDPKTAKYLNSPESEIYHKSKIVYGIYQARKPILAEDKCFLVEGYTDVLSMHEADIENVVASSGTSLTQEQVRLIKRFTQNITILYDGDEAGIKASLRGLDLVLEEGMNVKIVLLPDKEDPDSYSKKVSNEDFKTYLREKETDFIRFKTQLLLTEAQNDPVKKANLIRDIVRSIAVIPETITRTVYIKECSTLMEVSEVILYNEVNKLLRQKTFQDRNKYPGVEDIPLPRPIPERTVSPEASSYYSEREITRLLLKHGSEILYRKIGEPDGKEQITTVADYIVNEIISDELLFDNQVFTKIFIDYSFYVQQGLFPGDNHFVRHQDPEISSMSADLLSDSHVLSRFYKEHFINVETEEMLLKVLVPESVLKFKSDKIIIMRKKVLREMDDASRTKDMEKIRDLQLKYNTLNKALNQISKNLGDRIVL
jgi:DNA primase